MRLNEDDGKIPQSLLIEFDRVRKSINKRIARRAEWDSQGKTCDYCIWGNKIDQSKVFCPFPRCVKDNIKVG